MPDYEGDIYGPMEDGKTAFSEAMRAIESSRAVVEDAVLFCGRFNEDGRLLRESEAGKKPYSMLRVRNNAAYAAALKGAREAWTNLPARIAEAASRKAKARKAVEALRKRDARLKLREDDFMSSSDLGSTMSADPNQYTEYTPYFSGPFYKQQYWDYFKGHARAYELYNHSPIAHRVVDLLVQYAMGRGFKVDCKDKGVGILWKAFQQRNKLIFKMRKFWAKEYLIYGENFIDQLRWVSVDPSTIYDIVCEGYGEYIDDVLYYQQMFQTATTMYAGLSVPGVPGSKDSKLGRYIIRQIPYDQLIHIKTGVVSVEKRGRSVLYPILTYLKRLRDALDAQVLGEQLRAAFVFDDTVEGSDADVAAHGAKYAYIPVAPSIFVHNTAVKRATMAPMQGVTASQSSVVQELISIIATSAGIPKEHLNVLLGGSSNRATAVVGSEPFTKVIEDLQEDFSDLMHRIIERFCADNGLPYDPERWSITFPSVVKDSLLDRLKAIAFCQANTWLSERTCAIMAAAEMDRDDYDYDQEMKTSALDSRKKLSMGVAPPPPAVPDSRFGGGAQPGADDEEGGDNPIHGNGKKALLDSHKHL